MPEALTSREIGKTLKSLRLRAGLTQEELAERVGVTFQQIQKYENGSNKLNSDKLQSVAAALGVKVSALFDESVEAIPLSTQERELLASYRKIQDDKIKESLRIIANTSAKCSL